MKLGTCSGPDRFVAEFCGVVHEGVFKIMEGMAAGEIVRVPFCDGDLSEDLGCTMAWLLNSQCAIADCRGLHKALGLFLDDGDGSNTGVDKVKRAAAVVNAWEFLREHFAEE